MAAYVAFLHREIWDKMAEIIQITFQYGNQI